MILEPPPVLRPPLPRPPRSAAGSDGGSRGRSAATSEEGVGFSGGSRGAGFGRGETPHGRHAYMATFGKQYALVLFWMLLTDSS